MFFRKMSSVNFADPVTSPIPSTRQGLVPTDLFSKGSVVDVFMSAFCWHSETMVLVSFSRNCFPLALAHLLRGGEDGGDGFHVAGAAADDAGEGFADVGIGRGRV